MQRSPNQEPHGLSHVECQGEAHERMPRRHPRSEWSNRANRVAQGRHPRDLRAIHAGDVAHKWTQRRNDIPHHRRLTVHSPETPRF